MEELAESVGTAERLLASAGPATVASMTQDYRNLLCRLRDAQGAGMPAPSRMAALAADLSRDAAAALRSGMTGPEPWLSRQVQLAISLQERDPSNFLQWPVVRKAGIQSWRVREALNAYRALADSDDPQRWLDVAKDSAVGAPAWLEAHPQHSVNSVFVTSHLAEFKRRTGRDIREFDTILEFGGGYGALCRSAFRAGFRGRYIIFDLPIIGALQRFYLRAAGLPVMTIVQLAAAGEGIVAVSDTGALDAALGGQAGTALFVATWSLSETPADVRALVEPFLPHMSGALIAYQSSFVGFDNRAYFHRVANKLDKLSWRESCLPSQPLNYYLFGSMDASPPVVDLYRQPLWERAACRLVHGVDRLHQKTTGGSKG